MTKTTFKKFLRDNVGKLYIKNESDFDGMVDCVNYDQKATFQPVEKTDFMPDHSLEIKGLYLVGRSRDYFSEYNDGEYKGIEVDNCCGSDILAIKIN